MLRIFLGQVLIKTQVVSMHEHWRHPHTQQHLNSRPCAHSSNNYAPSPFCWNFKIVAWFILLDHAPYKGLILALTVIIFRLQHLQGRSAPYRATFPIITLPARLGDFQWAHALLVRKRVLLGALHKICPILPGVPGFKMALFNSFKRRGRVSTRMQICPDDLPLWIQKFMKCWTH